MHLLSLLKRNRYTTSVAIMATTFILSSCSDCVTAALCFANKCKVELPARSDKQASLP